MAKNARHFQQPEPEVRFAIVTGGGRGIGGEVSLRLAEAGFRVFAVQRTKPLVRGITWIRADFANPQAASRAVLRALPRQGAIHAIVHAASVYEPSGLEQADMASLRATWDIHLTTPMLLMSALAERLRLGRGAVVNILDAHVDRPMPRFAGYAAAKAALANLTLSWARALAPEVRVNAVSPGIITWPADMPAAERKRYLARTPIHRLVTVDEVAGAVASLVTGFPGMTGQILRLDGGRSLK